MTEIVLNTATSVIKTCNLSNF